MVTKLINQSMYNGKKSASQKQIYEFLNLLGKQTGKDPIVVLSAAMENIKPQMEVRPRRIGGAAYQVPTPVKNERSEALAIRWLIQYARKRPSSQFHSFSEKLVAEVTDALKGEGGSVKKRQDIHKMAEANRAFAHFRW